MADQVETPGSNADSSVNNANKNSATKDKACPFCGQQFTSSSLGRHLDLYIKEKNPKPADGIHDVVEIRKMRGGITRRQPRTSLRREGSTPNGTPGANGMHNDSRRHSPACETGRDRSRGQDKPSLVTGRYVHDETPKGGVVTSFFDRPSWHATGVINDIPPVAAVDSNHGRHDDNDYGSRRMNGHQVVSKQTLAKSTFDQKQKLMEALDNARASELALREVLGSLKAAVERVNPSTIPFDYDPFSLDFPALTLRCLPPPPTLRSVSPVPSPHSWSLQPPAKPQFEALCAHFAEEFRSWRIPTAIRARANSEDMYNPSQDHSDSPASIASNASAIAQAQVTEIEERISAHLHAVFTHWSSLPNTQQAEYWRLELSRAVGAKSDTIKSLRSNCDKILQENAHLRQQVEYLSRCQQPREFQMMPPATVPADTRVVNELGEMYIKQGSVGLNIADRDESLHEMVQRSIGRWREVVQTARGANKGMDHQRNLAGPLQNPHLRSTSALSRGSGEATGDIEMNDADADADAEGEVDGDGFLGGEEELRRAIGKPAPLAPMSNNSGTRADLGNGADEGGYKPVRL